VTRDDYQTLAAAVPVAAVAVIAAIVSYSHIEALALAQHQTITDARLLPFSVDALILAGSAILLAGSLLGWPLVAAGVAGTVFANVMSGLPYGPLAATVASWPAISFALASLVLERWLNRQVKRGGQGGQFAAVETPSDLPELVQDRTPEPEVATCGHEVAGTVEELIVNAYLHGRDCLGEVPSQRSLAATYGLHRTKVAQLVGSLNGHHPPEDP
jgi:Protein of unknown function (DUF2637)